MPPAVLSPQVLNWLVAVWLFALGGAIGSFLNVVIHRLPAGMSLLRPGSHCPACKQPIRWFDNVPIISWLILGGRCRDCRAAISPRYPAVEAVTATMFVVLGMVEVFSGGTNLPQLCAMYAYHLLLLCTLLAAVMIDCDGRRVPVRLFVPAVAVGLLGPLAWPFLHPVPAFAALDVSLAEAADGATGLAAGLLLGGLAAGLCRPTQRTGMVLAAACVGVFLGWQAAVVLVIVTVAIHLPLLALAGVLSDLRRMPPTVWLALATLGWILAWALLVHWGEGL